MQLGAFLPIAGGRGRQGPGIRRHCDRGLEPIHLQVLSREPKRFWE